MVFYQDFFELIRPEFQHRGFDFAEYDKHFCSLDFYMKKSEVDFLISIQYFNDSIKVNAFFGTIILHDVNKILKEFLDFGLSNENYTVIDPVYKKEHLGILSELNSDLFRNDSQKEIFKVQILRMVDDKILPFFHDKSNIHAINEKILNQVPEKDFLEWIHGKSTYKILIIMKLCENPKYETYKESKEKEFIIFAKRNPARWEPAYKIFRSLVKYLDEGRYMELIKTIVT